MGESREEFEIFCGIASRMGLDAPSPSPAKQALGREGKLPAPVDDLDMALRMGPIGDRCGENPGGWSREKLREHPHGVMVETMPHGATDWRERIGYPDRKLRLWHELLAPEFDRLFASRTQAPPGLTLIGRRDIRSINSWMHNVDKLVRSQEPALLVHPQDAAAHGVDDGDIVRLWNANGEIHVPAALSVDIVQGTVCYPHGWGHAAGWDRANRTEGKNVNLLLGLGVDSIEFVSGMSLMDCIDVSMERSHINAPAEAVTLSA